MRKAFMTLIASVALPCVLLSAGPAGAATRKVYRSVCDPIQWREHMKPVVANRPSECGYWGKDGNGPLSDVIGVNRLQWSSWGRVARARGWTVPTHGGQGEKPIRARVTLSKPYACRHAGKTRYLYTHETVRTKYGRASFDTRTVPEDYCEVATEPEPQASFKLAYAARYVGYARL